MKKWLFVGLLAVGCNSDHGMKTVSYDGLFNDENSKVWLVDQSILGGANVGAFETSDKDVLIFHKTGEVQYTPLKKISAGNIPTGKYTLDSENRVLSLYFKDEIWTYDLAYIEEDSILLVPSENADTRYSLKIIPLPLL